VNRKLVLINPVNPARTGLTVNKSSRFPPIGLGIVAALTPAHWDVELVDENWEPFAYRDADLVGITAFTASANRAYQIAAAYRARGVPVVMGGIHASMRPAEAQRFVDAVVVGEAETVWPQVVADAEAGRLQPVYGGSWPDLAGAPVPRRDLFHPGYMFASVQTSRGCPLDCEFCSVTAFNGHRYRRRPPAEVLDELATIPQKYLFFVDDNIIGYGPSSREQALALFRGLVERRLDKWWFCQASLNFADDEEVLHWAGRAGCQMVFLGLEAERLNRTNKDLLVENLRVGKMFAGMFPTVFFTLNLGTLLVIWYGGYQVINDQLTLGELVAFNSYLMLVMFPLGILGMIITMISRAAASAERVFEILDARSEVVERPDAIPLPPIQGRVEFDHVSFRYFGTGEWVLRDVSFTAQPGQTIALLGATGSGKSTIINLIPRFYDVTEGAVRIDGHDVRDVTIESLRSQIGIVLQETTLFAGTIRENIAFGRPEATLDEIVAAAQAAEAHDFIAALEMGYDTPVGERGVTLSGGQKQRLAIARALLLDPRILILDDSTSAVDLETEYRIQQALEKLMAGRTSFVIAQRIATVLNADMILVLERGRVVARGSHEELLHDSPIYAEIYHSQLVADTDGGSE